MYAFSFIRFQEWIVFDILLLITRAIVKPKAKKKPLFPEVKIFFYRQVIFFGFAPLSPCQMK
jgi:hypothetical protein